MAQFLYVDGMVDMALIFFDLIHGVRLLTTLVRLVYADPKPPEKQFLSCSHQKLEQLKINPHPMDKYRTNCPLARLKLFQSTYNIKKGDKMFWDSTDTIW